MCTSMHDAANCRYATVSANPWRVFMFVCNFVCICVIAHARARVYLHARVYNTRIFCACLCVTALRIPSSIWPANCGTNVCCASIVSCDCWSSAQRSSHLSCMYFSPNRLTIKPPQPCRYAERFSLFRKHLDTHFTTQRLGSNDSEMQSEFYIYDVRTKSSADSN